MKMIKNLSLLALFSAFLFTSCKDDIAIPNDGLAHVPSTATSVTAINVQQLMKKADFGEIKEMEFYREMLNEVKKERPSLVPVFEDPKKSGVDLEGKIYLAAEVSKDNPEEIVTCVFIPLKNAGDFEKVLTEAEVEITTAKGFKIVRSEDNSFLAWNESLALAGMTNGEPSALEEYITGLFNMDKTKSIASNKDLQKALNNNHDISAWFSTDQLAENPGAGMALSMVGINAQAFKGNYIHSYADFEKGRMTGHADFHVNSDLGENFIGRFFKKEVAADFSRILPKENLVFATVAAVDLRGIDRFLSEQPQSQGYADFVLKDFGIKRQDIISTFGGDLLVAGFGSKQQDGEQEKNFLVATSLKDVKKAREILQIAVKDGRLKEIEKDYFTVKSIGNEDFTITVNKGMGRLLLVDDLLCFSTDEKLLEKIKSGNLSPNERADSEVLKSFDGQTLGAWFTFDEIKKVFGKLEGTFFKEMKFNVNGKGADFVLETGDENTNSLKAIFLLLNEMFLQRKTDERQAL